MARRRRKGPSCPNCGTGLRPEFEFCPHCGQENHDLRVPFKIFLYEFVESITHFDTKLWNTL
ncbi:MAG TPA: zinc ribbon domain-containing protein [Flavobacteriales bacterium]|nr:zinc ribbon domain-containing protein [Flavobacteriales bacterium]HNE78964.1 zinc ribbon domain-containing protein [Flavobacteriales bacterium]HNI05155.1 zinc ribbon domain-containing protein [Flavobacteriales bacterium]HNK40675.1 zinc ribbon domain-containing protein [Flavobacteriales bacterium]HNK68210.1 zinc ribbon domain-containing protein [Flavobacteriales bacterium]